MPSALVLLFLFVCDVWFSSIVRFGHGGGAAAGMRGLVSSVNLCEYPPYIRHHTIKIALQPPITASLPSTAAIVSTASWKKGGGKKRHLKQHFNRTGKTHLCVGFISFHSRWMCWIRDTAIRNQPVSHYVSLRALVCDPGGVNKSILWHNKRSWFSRFHAADLC